MPVEFEVAVAVVLLGPVNYSLLIYLWDLFFLFSIISPFDEVRLPLHKSVLQEHSKCLDLSNWNGLKFVISPPGTLIFMGACFYYLFFSSWYTSVSLHLRVYLYLTEHYFT